MHVHSILTTFEELEPKLMGKPHQIIQYMKQELVIKALMIFFAMYGKDTMMLYPLMEPRILFLDLTRMVIQ